MEESQLEQEVNQGNIKDLIEKLDNKEIKDFNKRLNNNYASREWCNLYGISHGVQHTDEARANMSAAHSDERHHMYGKHLSEATKQKISRGMAGKQNRKKPHSEETKRKIRKALMGHQVSAETRAKQSAAKRGKPSSFKGKHHTAKTKQKISNIKKGINVGKQNHFYGKHHSEKTKRRISEALRAYWRRKRAEEQETP